MNGPSNGGHTIPREIVEGRVYAQQADEIDQERQILDEELSGLFFIIGRIPELYEEMPGPTGAPMCVADNMGSFRVRIWFTYNDDIVLLLGIIRLSDG